MATFVGFAFLRVLCENPFMNKAPFEVRLDTSLESLLDSATRDAGAGVMATLVATAGSTYRKPGARMLIMADGSFFGLLSGGCLEADLGLHAREVMTSGRARAVEYDMRGPDDVLFGIGAGCEGAMRVLLEPVGPDTPAAAALAGAGRATRAGEAASLVMVHDSRAVALGTYDAATLSGAVPAETAAALRAAAGRAVQDCASLQLDFPGGGGAGRAFVQFLAPPPHLLICGAGPDAQPVAAAALGLGWRVTVVDHRPAYAVAQRFPGAQVRCADAGGPLPASHAAVVMSHHLASDVAYLRVLADSGSPDYVGLLGPPARRRRIGEELGAAAEGLRSRIRGPVGIDIGAVTPEGIALSIVAQIHASLAGRERR